MNESSPLPDPLAPAGRPALAVPGPRRSGLDLSGFDRSVRPQDDLYSFAGGRWLASTRIPADLSNYGVFTELHESAQEQLHRILEQTLRAHAAPGTDQRKLADFYASVLNCARIEALGLAPLAVELARVEAIASVAELVRHIGYGQTIGVGGPMAWSAPQDPGDAQSYISEIDQSGLSMPDRDYYLLDEPIYREYRAQLEAYAGALLQSAGAERSGAARDARTVLQLETQLAQAHWTRVENRDPVKTYNRLTPDEAARLAPQIDWRALFDAVGAPAGRFVIRQPGFIAALGQLLEAVPLADWRVYCRYRLLDAYAPFLPAAFDQLHFEFHQRTLSGVQQQRPRWKRAVAILDRHVGEIAGRRYVARRFPPQSKQRVQQLVANLLTAYERSIDELDWMGPQTRAQARLKLSKMMVKVGYPDQWRDYAALTIDADDLLGNIRRSMQFELQRRAARLGGPVERGEWHMTPQTVNAYYDPTMNEIVFPAAILQPPFFDPDADDAVNYGAIGAVIGHEISHGFDDQGRRFDADGNLRDWWMPDDAERFRARTAALVAQYGAYDVLDGLHVNGELTLGENIADLSGLAIAYRAYLICLHGRAAPIIDGFTGPQRFFLGWAQIWRRKYRDDDLRMRILVDPHSPNEFRVRGPVGNNDAYHEAFGVRPDDRMYRPPAERVKIW